MPPAWLLKFPSGDELARKAIELRRDSTLGVDARLIARRDCEYQIFLSVERVLEMPRIAAGFGSIDQFVTLAHSILQRRKSRAGRSLELHARHIFIEEGLSEGLDFSAQPESEPKKKPDFLFPSEAAYKDSSFPQERLRMLAVKTTCKDRWRQIVKEADRVGKKHLLTLQEGVSENQFREMVEADVQLVVPKRLIQSYPESVRPHLQTLSGFIEEVRGLAAGNPA